DCAIETARRPVLDRVGTDHLRTDDGLGYRAEHVTDPLANCGVCAGETALEVSQQQEERNEHEPDEQGELPRIDRHDGGSHDELTDADHEEQPGPLHEGRDRVDITGDSGHERSAPLCRLMQDREIVYVAEGL